MHFAHRLKRTIGSPTTQIINALVLQIDQILAQERHRIGPATKNWPCNLFKHSPQKEAKSTSNFSLNKNSSFIKIIATFELCGALGLSTFDHLPLIFIYRLIDLCYFRNTLKYNSTMFECKIYSVNADLHYFK